MKWALLANLLFALVDLAWKQAQQYNSVSVNTAIRSWTSTLLLGCVVLVVTPNLNEWSLSFSHAIQHDFRIIGVGLLGWLGLWAFGKSLKDGALHIIIPVVALTPVVTYVFWFFQHNSRWMPLENLAILSLMIAGILLSFQFQRNQDPKAPTLPILWACLASCSWGLSYSWYESVTSQIGAIPTAAWVEACIAFGSASLLLWKKSNAFKEAKWPLLTGIITALAVLTTVQSYAEHGTESTAIAGVVTPVLSIFGAWIINKERPIGLQWVSLSILIVTLIWQALRLA
ncbi:MAG: DMT family transporter [Bacteroidetes bacterium]|nr:DMT family transporter [Bacteroidota bacterium]MDA0943435.1 DMT family transporter [Bacteroidota bacterium]MDA1111706.1 DMT family transporter [Bacteroidota bacterium]